MPCPGISVGGRGDGGKETHPVRSMEDEVSKQCFMSCLDVGAVIQCCLKCDECRGRSKLAKMRQGKARL
jgi:hypothetical protein